MTKKTIKTEGLLRGLSIGKTLLEMNEFPTKDNYLNTCYETEQNDRQYTPFEFTAKELSEKSLLVQYDPWDIFEQGINKGFEKAYQWAKKGMKKEHLNDL